MRGQTDARDSSTCRWQSWRLLLPSPCPPVCIAQTGVCVPSAGRETSQSVMLGAGSGAALLELPQQARARCPAAARRRASPFPGQGRVGITLPEPPWASSGAFCHQTTRVSVKTRNSRSERIYLDHLRKFKALTKLVLLGLLANREK